MKKLIMLLITATLLCAGSEKVFVRDYTYRASEDDSKNSARQKASEQLKALISEEVGVYIESSLDIKQNSSKGVDSGYIKSEIRSLSASISKLHILEEEWDGETYYMKARVVIDEDQTMTLILEAIKAKASEKDIKRLNAILAEQNRELDHSYSKVQELQKTLIKQEIENQASKKELEEARKKLNRLEAEQRKNSEHLSQVRQKIKQAEERIRRETNLACQLKRHMTKDEVQGILGYPQSDNWALGGIGGKVYGKKALEHNESSKWYYGGVVVNFQNNIVSYIEGCR